MSTAAVATTSIYQEIQTFYQQRKSDLAQLGTALQAGDLNGAQQAYNTIVTLGEGGPFANGEPFRATQREQDFAAVGQALQAGDVNAAQQAFAQLEATFHHHATSGQNNPTTVTASTNSAPASQPGPAVVVNLGQTGANATAPASPSAIPASTALPEIVINLGINSSTPEQVTLDLTNTGNGTEQLTVSASQANQPPEQLAVNFNPNSNEQIVLNLLNSVSTTSTPSQSKAVSVLA